MAMKKFICFACALGMAFTGALAQDSVSVQPHLKTQLSFEQLQWDNLWLGGDGAAGMIFNTHSLSDFQFLATSQTGAYRNVYDPQSALTVGLKTSSYQQLGKVVVHGSFQYRYAHRNGQRWLGLIDPYRTPFMLADSVVGDYALEQYVMEAGVAVPLTEHVTAGLLARYKAYSGAKQKDLRNKDTYMDFEMAPSVVFQMGPMRAGLHGVYGRVTEQVDYTQVETSTNKTLFSFMGQWMNTQEIYSTSVPDTRLLKDEVWGGGVTLQYVWPSFTLYESFSLQRRTQTQREDQVLAQQYGRVEEGTLQNELILQYGTRHQLYTQFSLQERQGLLPVQQQVLNESSRLWEWVQYGTTLSSLQQCVSGQVRYTFRINRNPYIDAWRFVAGAQGSITDDVFYKYPLSMERGWRYIEGYLRVTKNFQGRKQMVDITPECTYGTGSFVQASLFDNAEEALMYQDPSSAQLAEPLAQENAFMTDPNMSAGLTARLTFFIQPQKGVNGFIQAAYFYRKRLADVRDDRHNAVLSVGVTF